MYKNRFLSQHICRSHLSSKLGLVFSLPAAAVECKYIQSIIKGLLRTSLWDFHGSALIGIFAIRVWPAPDGYSSLAHAG